MTRCLIMDVGFMLGRGMYAVRIPSTNDLYGFHVDLDGERDPVAAARREIARRKGEAYASACFFVAGKD